MTSWKERVLIGDLYAKYESNLIKLSEVAKAIADRISSCKYGKNPTIIGLCSELRDVDDEDAFDDVMEALYDFGDERNRIWFDPTPVVAVEVTED